MVIPAVDLKDGKCVRLIQGKKDKEIVFDEDPVRMALKWQDEGAQFLHLVDLDGAFEGKPRNLPVIEKIITAISIPAEIGGGIRDEKTVKLLLDIGLERVIIGTRAVSDPEWFTHLVDKYPQKIVLGIDAQDGWVAIRGWTEVSALSVSEMLAKFDAIPLCAIIYTDISKDGMLEGPNIPRIKEVVKESPFPVIASGGISTIENIRELSALDIAGMIIGRSLYEGTLSIKDALDVVRCKGK